VASKEKRDTPFPLRLPASLRQKLKDVADEKHTSVNELIVRGARKIAREDTSPGALHRDAPETDDEWRMTYGLMHFLRHENYYEDLKNFLGRFWKVGPWKK
jgi:hypothetical protein